MFPDVLTIFPKCFPSCFTMFPTSFPGFSPVFRRSWRRVPRCGDTGTTKAQAAEEQQQPCDQPGDGPGETRQKVEGRGARTRGRHDDVHLDPRAQLMGFLHNFEDYGI